MRADQIDEGFAPRQVAGVERVGIGTEVVLLNGWRSATVLNPTATQIWDSFDGRTLDEIARHLSALHDADLTVVRRETAALARQVAESGLLAGVESAPLDVEEELLTIEPSQSLTAGDSLDDFAMFDLDGIQHSLSDYLGTDLLLVNWNPQCGYCSTIVDRLALLHPALAGVDVALILVATGDAAANRPVVEAAGLKAPVLLLEDGVDPFMGHGTPAAYHLGADGVLRAPMVFGAPEVLRLASSLAGIGGGLLQYDSLAPVPAGTRYLLDPGGMCGPQDATASSLTVLEGVRVYRINGYHVGVGFDSPSTATKLDELFPGAQVDDRNLGQSYSVALTEETNSEEPTAEFRRPARKLNRLVQGGDHIVRSRFTNRVLRALLWRLSEDMSLLPAEDGHVRVTATAMRVGNDALLLQPGLSTLADQLQPRFAQEGIAFVDVPFPQIDLASAELVVPAPQVQHDLTILEEPDLVTPATQSELSPVLPGRYPLLGWCVTYPSDESVVDLSPAAAAAATLSTVLDTENAVDRIGQLGDLFAQVQGFGIWYHTGVELVDAVVSALKQTPSNSV